MAREERKKGRFREILSRLRRACRFLDRRLRGASVSVLAWEYREMENLFALSVLSPAAGVPGTPSGLSLDLLPLLEHELLVLLDRARASGDPWGELFSLFEVT